LNKSINKSLYIQQDYSTNNLALFEYYRDIYPNYTKLKWVQKNISQIPFVNLT